MWNLPVLRNAPGRCGIFLFCEYCTRFGAESFWCGIFLFCELLQVDVESSCFASTAPGLVRHLFGAESSCFANCSRLMWNLPVLRVLHQVWCGIFLVRNLPVLRIAPG